MYNKEEQTDKGVSFMEGRRVSRRKPRRNPLYTLFMGLLALSLVLFITVIVLSFKLKGARRDLADAQTKIEQLRGGSWKDPISYIRSAWRTWEYQNQPRSYIGFRCVRSKATTVSSNAAEKKRK